MKIENVVAGSMTAAGGGMNGCSVATGGMQAGDRKTLLLLEKVLGVIGMPATGWAILVTVFHYQPYLPDACWSADTCLPVYGAGATNAACRGYAVGCYTLPRCCLVGAARCWFTHDVGCSCCDCWTTTKRALVLNATLSAGRCDDMIVAGSPGWAKRAQAWVRRMLPARRTAPATTGWACVCWSITCDAILVVERCYWRDRWTSPRERATFHGLRCGNMGLPGAFDLPMTRTHVPHFALV